MSSTTTCGPPEHSLVAAVEQAREQVQAACQAASWSVSDEELTGMVTEVEALSAQVAALSLSVIREVEARDLGRRAGSTGTSNWLSGEVARLEPHTAGSRAKLAGQLDRELRLTNDTLATGKISLPHAQVIAATMRDLPTEAGPEVRAEAEVELVSLARRFHPGQLRQAARTILEVVDPELADRVLARKLAAEEAKAGRAPELSLRPDPYLDGVTHVRGKLDAESSEMFRQAVEPFAKPRPSDAHGPDTRSHAQRMGEGLAEVLRRFLAAGDLPEHGGNRPQVVVTVTDRDLRQRTGYGRLLHTGTAISTEQVRRLTCDAQISYVWAQVTPGDLAGADRARSFTGKLRRLLELRDRGCAFPGCDRPPAWCVGHHIIPWQDGGPTVLTNGVLICGHHHRLIHREEWTIRLGADHLPEFVPPEWIDSQRQALRNTRLRI